jgi:hypothetical protein
MSMTIQVPEDLYRQAKQIAETNDVSVDEVFASAFLEHLAVLERFNKRAARGDRERFLALLDKAPDVEPHESDRL